MDSGSETAICLIAGLLVVGIAATTLSPAGERTMVSQVVGEGEQARGGTVTDYSNLSRPAQLVVDEVIQQGYTTLSTYEDYRAVEELQGDRYIRTDEGVFHIRTTSADGSGGLLEGITRDSALALGGILIGTGIVLRSQRRYLLRLIVLPTGAVIVVLSANALAAPTLSKVSWLGNTSFGLAATVPVLIGIALRQRDYRTGVLALATLLLSAGVLLFGNALSALHLLAPLVLFGLPGVVFGRWIDTRRAEMS